MQADLARKLLLEGARSARLWNAPPGLAEALDIPAPGQTAATWLLAFVPDSEALERALPELRSMAPGSIIWIAYRKGGAKAGTDLNRDILWRRLELEGLTGVTLVAIDEEWSAMRFRRPEEVGS